MRPITYRGLREDGPGSATVTIYQNHEPIGFLAPRNDLMNHSPNGFEWGYLGSGPAQLALALCAHALHERGTPFADASALRFYQLVKEALIAPLNTDAWELSIIDVLNAVDDAENARGPLELVSCDLHGTTHLLSQLCPVCLEEEQEAE